MKFAVENDKIEKVIIGDDLELDLSSYEISFEQFDQELKEPLEKIEGVITPSTSDSVKEWKNVYKDCTKKGKMVLEVIAEGDGEAPYSELKKKLQSEGITVVPYVFAGIFKGINRHIEEHISVVKDEPGSARDNFIKIEKRDGDEYRVIDDEEYAEALKEAVL